MQRAAGTIVFGLASFALGVIDLAFGDFASVWQPIQAFGDVPFRHTLSIICAMTLALGGAASLWERSARIGTAMLAAVYFAFAIMWLPRVIGFPRIFGTWSGFTEEFAYVTACAIALGFAKIGRAVFAVCLLVFGCAHFFALPQTAQLVPAWLAPGQTFWAAFTGAAFLLAGIAMLTRIRDVLAARLATAMFVVFGALVWLPSLIAHPALHTVWAGNAINLAMAGAAWIAADSIAELRRNA